MVGLRVALISGSYPPDACGVGAYVERLVVSLREQGLEVELVTGSNWRALDARSIRRRIEGLRPDIVHVQYPTLGYGAGLAPHVLSVLHRSIVTLHEVRYTHPLRQLSLATFALSARRIVFTADAERRYVLRFAPFLRERSAVIPVGSSVPAVESVTKRNETEVVHFGLIRPEKGLEDVIELARLLRGSGSSLGMRVVGDVAPRFSKYFQALKRSSARLPITWQIGLSLPRVADVLAQSKIAYVPFPDGASERRTSLLALLDAGVATITTRGADTPPALADAVAFADGPVQAFDLIAWLSEDENAWEHLAAEGRRYARQLSWERIASMHVALYEDVLDDRTSAVTLGR